MSIFSHIKHAFQHLGHDIASIGKGIAHAAESVGKTLVHDVEAVAKQTVALTNDLVHMRLQQALHDYVKLGSTALKGMVDVGSAAGDVAVKGLENAHLSKGLDKALHKVDQARGFVKDVTDRTIDSVGNAATGMYDGVIAAGKDVAHGHVGSALGHLGGAAGSAVELATDLTPEGLAATAASQVLQKTHLGGAVVDSVVEGALSRGRDGVSAIVKTAAKEGAKTAGGIEVNKLLDKAADGNGSTALGYGAAGLSVAADLHASRSARRQTSEAPAAYTPQHYTVHDDHPDAPGRKGKKHHHDAEVDSNQNNGKTGQNNNGNNATVNGTQQQPGANGNANVNDQILQLQLAQQQSTQQKMMNSLKASTDDDDEDGDDVTSKASAAAPQASPSSSASGSTSVSSHVSSNKKAA